MREGWPQRGQVASRAGALSVEMMLREPKRRMKPGRRCRRWRWRARGIGGETTGAGGIRKVWSVARVGENAHWECEAPAEPVGLVHPTEDGSDGASPSHLASVR